MRKINAIVIHYSDSADVSAATIRQWHLARGWLDIGYHSVIRQDGKVEPGRPEKQTGAHTLGFNANSLGVCLTGSDRELWYPTPAQLASLQAVLRDWMKRYDIPAANIFLHREKSPTSCPGRLDKSKVMALLGTTGSTEPTPTRTPPRGNQDQRPKQPTIRRGAKGAVVSLLQQRLNIHHVSVKIDGDFGPKTEAGVRAFQSARRAQGVKVNGLLIQIDGIVGPATWSLLLQPAGR